MTLQLQQGRTRTLRYGAVGNEVAELQKGLNLLPSNLARLKTDGIYGDKTTARVREFQKSNSLLVDGVTGPYTWAQFFQLLAGLLQGENPLAPAPYFGISDVIRGAILMIAQQHLGRVDFQPPPGVNLATWKPKGLEFLIHMFMVAANLPLTEKNFWDPKKKIWTQEPWVYKPDEPRKSWCGIFCVYCYKLAGVPVVWDLSNGRPSYPVKITKIGSDLTPQQWRANIRPGDIGCVSKKNHHFLIEEIGSGPEPRFTTIDGNQEFGRIVRYWMSDPDAHHVAGGTGFGYYSIRL